MTNQMISATVSVSSEMVRGRILTIRGVQVLLDRDLAELYGVSTGALNQAVKRNRNRFPERFMFERIFSKLTQQGRIARVGGKRFGHWEVNV